MNISLFSIEARARIVPVAWSTLFVQEVEHALAVEISFSSVSLIRTGSWFLFASDTEPI